MIIFFDTEFTQLSKDGELISLGMITDGGSIFYAEFTDFSTELLTDWHYENVIKNLANKCIPKKLTIRRDGTNVSMSGTKEEVREELLTWLNGFNQDIQLVSDVCHYDFMLFIDIFGTAFDLPECISPYCIDINQEISKALKITNKEAFDVDRDDFAENGTENISIAKHNALWDAKVIRDIYNTINCKLK